MKKIEMTQVFNPRMGWDRDCKGVYCPEESYCGKAMGWGEYIDGDSPADGSSLPEGSVTISGGFNSVEAVLCVKDGRVVDVAVAEECTWWDDPTTTQTWAPENGETLHAFGWRTESDPVSDSLEDDISSSLDPERRTSQFWVRNVDQAKSLDATYLRSIGAFLDAEDRVKVAKSEITKQKKERYEEAKERCELLYPIVAPRVFRAHIRWALETRVADAAKAIALYPEMMEEIRNSKAVGGWQCHSSKLSRAFHRAYGWSTAGEVEFEALCDACNLTQPRLESAWEIAKLL